MKTNKAQKTGMDFSIVIPVVVVTLVACVLIVMFPEATGKVMDAAFALSTGTLGWLFIAYIIMSLGLVIYFSIGRYANKKLGEGPPERSTFSWLAMMFANASSAAVIYWCVVEFYYYLQTPPFGADAFSQEAMTWASAYGAYHWGFINFSMYAALAVLIGFMIHVKKAETSKISTACVGIIGEKNENGLLGKLIDGIYLFCVLISVAGVSLGLSTPLVGTLVESVFGISHDLIMDAFIILIITILFTVSVYTGLQKGMKYVSWARSILAFGLLAYVLVVGPTSFIVSNALESLGTQLQYFVQMTTYTDVTGGSGFPQNWTIFYFAWFLTTSLQGGLYCGRLSKGRTVRQTAIGTLCANAVGCMMFFWLMGNYSISVYMDDPVVFGALMDSNPYDAMIYVWSQLPLPFVVLVLFCIFAFIATWSLVQGGAYTLAMVSEKNLGDKEPSKLNRIFWCIIIGALALSLLFLGGLQTVKNSAMISAMPLLVISTLAVVSLMKDMIKTWGKKELKTNGNIDTTDGASLDQSIDIEQEGYI